MKKIDVSNPLALSKIIASEGLTNQIPADASSVAEQYNASQDIGFPEVTMKPVEIGGEAPDGRDFNGFLQLLSSHLFASQNGGIYTFNADVSSAIGGYPQGAILGYIDTNGDYNFVKSLIDDNTYNFVNNPAYIDGEHWEKIVYPGAANTDLSNLTLQGKNISNWSSNVTNCITEISQDIKLELNNGVLTLKAGSKVYVPNGFENDGITPKFDVVTIANDITTPGVSFTGDCFYIVDGNGTSFAPRAVDQCATFTTIPTSAISNIYEGYCLEDNKMYVWSIQNNTWAVSGRSLPIGIINLNSTSPYNREIKQVFNGFGYIGPTIFALPGVKGLIPDGRNEDGSLKSIEITVENVLTSQVGGTVNVHLLLNASGFYSSNNTFNYNIKENFNYQNNNKLAYLDAGLISISSNVITSFNFKSVFQTVDYSDVPNLQQVNVLPVNPDSNIWYAIPE